MSKDFSEAAIRQSRQGPSLFPAMEPASFCSRPTPIVPPRDDLRNFDASNGEQADGRISLPSVSPSSRPTVAPGDDLLYPTFDAEERATRPGISLVPDEPLVPVPSHAESSSPVIALGPVVYVTAPSPPETEEPPVPVGAPWRRWFARSLFAVLFGAVATLLGYAVKPKAQQLVQELRGEAVPKLESTK
jgi:hypothetical protein